RSFADQSPPPIVAGALSSSGVRPASRSWMRASPSRSVASASTRITPSIGSAPVARWDRQVPPRMSGPARPAEVNVDVLELAVFVEADFAVLATDPRLLVAAERVARVDHMVVVDP